MKFILLVSLVVFSSCLSHAQTSSLATIEENGPRSRRINVVFLSEGYTAAQMGTFAAHAQASVDYLFSREPWNRHRSYCNIYRIEIASNQQGTDNGSGGGTRDTYFNSGFNTPAIPQLLTVPSSGISKAFSLLNKHVPEYDVPIVLVNDSKYGGSGGVIAVASANSFSVEVLEHELGHSFVGLTDEYDFDFPGYPATEFANATAKTSRAQIRWNTWIQEATPVPTPEDTVLYEHEVGLFEGANYRARGWFRPHDNSLMRNLARPVGQVNREAFLLAYYARVKPHDDALPAQSKFSVNQRQTLRFQVHAKSPAFDPLAFRWLINGTLRSGAESPILEFPSHELGNGTHTVKVEIEDRTSWIRRDTANLRKSSITWTVTLSNQGLPPVIETPPAHQVVSLGAAIEPLSVDASVSGSGSLRYQWFKNGKALARATTAELDIATPAATPADGALYTVRVTDTATAAFIERPASVFVGNPAIKAQVVKVGAKAVLQLDATGHVTGCEWKWNANMDSPTELELPAGQDSSFSPDGRSLTLKKARLEDSGLYTCRPQLLGGGIWAGRQILHVVDLPPVLNHAPQSQLTTAQVGAIYGPEPVLTADISSRTASKITATGLPPGLTLDPLTGSIRGVPTRAKMDKNGAPLPYAVTLTASNPAGSTSVVVDLVVLPMPEGTVTPFHALVQRAGLSLAAATNSNQMRGGRLDVVPTTGGSYSATLVYGLETYKFKGPMRSVLGSRTVTASYSIQRKNTPLPLHLTFTLDGSSHLLVGMLTEGQDAAAVEMPLEGWFNIWPHLPNKADAYDGYHSFALDLKDAMIPLGGPRGHGIGSFKAGLDGKLTLTGKTADGESFTTSGWLGPQGEVLIFSLLNGTPKGSLCGTFSLSTQGNDDDEDNRIVGDSAKLAWWRPATANSKTRVHREGFEPLPLLILGGRYTPPAAPLVIMNQSIFPGNASLTFQGTGIESASRNLNTLLDILTSSQARASTPGLAGTKVSFNPKTGAFAGKAALLDDNPRGIPPLQVPRAVSWQGMIIPRAAGLEGRGYMLLPDLPSDAAQDTPTTSTLRSQAVELTPTSPP